MLEKELDSSDIASWLEAASAPAADADANDSPPPSPKKKKKKKKNKTRARKNNTPPESPRWRSKCDLSWSQLIERNCWIFTICKYWNFSFNTNKEYFPTGKMPCWGGGAMPPPHPLSCINTRRIRATTTPYSIIQPCHCCTHAS
jgi:hypothetical protein